MSDSDLKTDEHGEGDPYEDLRDKYALILRERVENGETLTPGELSFLETAHDADDFPARLHVRPPKMQRSPAQQLQTQKNLSKINDNKLQTGPKTDQGKAKSARNAIKHGLYAQGYMSLFRPCFTTCPEYPCSVVLEGATSPGDHCLDKQVFIEVLDAVEKAMRHKQFDDFNDVLAMEVAANIDMLRKLRHDVAANGGLVKSIKVTKTGGDNPTEIEQIEYKLHPAFLALGKLIDTLGLTPAEAMITPREVARHGIDTKAVETMGERASKAGQRLIDSLRGKRGEDK